MRLRKMPISIATGVLVWASSGAALQVTAMLFLYALDA